MNQYSVGELMNMKVIGRLSLVAVITIVTGCNKDGRTAGGARTDTAVEAAAGGTQGAVNSAAIGGGLSDPNIFYVLDAANMGDSAKGALATTKGTSADVRAFAKMMVRDHHTLRQQGQDLAKRLVIQPTAPPGDSLPAKLDSALSKLNSAAKGRDFDKAYIDHEVGAHREVLTILVSAMSMTQNSEIKNLIQNAAPIVQAHLDKAEAIRKNLQK
jgi:putative membrane protein